MHKILKAPEERLSTGRPFHAQLLEPGLPNGSKITLHIRGADREVTDHEVLALIKKSESRLNPKEKRALVSFRLMLTRDETLTPKQTEFMANLVEKAEREDTQDRTKPSYDAEKGKAARALLKVLSNPDSTEAYLALLPIELVGVLTFEIGEELGRIAKKEGVLIPKERVTTILASDVLRVACIKFRDCVEADKVMSRSLFRYAYRFAMINMNLLEEIVHFTIRRLKKLELSDAMSDKNLDVVTLRDEITKLANKRPGDV
ncbi:hypothetical protein HZC08_00745 [Candidatus Micrarchaeota archaeon]|nr:hypothetical protein [Candidatus Micrarchaeota archaeon]